MKDPVSIFIYNKPLNQMKLNMFCIHLWGQTFITFTTETHFNHTFGPAWILTRNNFAHVYKVTVHLFLNVSANQFLRFSDKCPVSCSHTEVFSHSLSYTDANTVARTEDEDGCLILCGPNDLTFSERSSLASQRSHPLPHHHPWLPSTAPSSSSSSPGGL